MIDNATGTLYCLAKTTEGTSYFQRLHALDITSGQEKLGGPVVIDATVLGTGDGSVGGSIRFNQERHLNRPALLLASGYLYLAFGSQGDQRPYHGWVLSYDAATLQQVASFNVTPSGWGGSVWESGQGLALDESGYIYFMTGNGTFDMNAGGKNCSSCFIKLSTPDLNVVDWFAPYNQNDLNVNDFDLNSSGPLLLPGFNRLVGGGKEGILYVLDRAHMGHFQAGSNSQIVQNVQITFGDHLHGSPIYWESPVHGPLVYVWYQENHLEAFKVVNGAFENNVDPNTGLLAPITQSAMAVPPGMPGGVLSLSANGTAPRSGVVWAIAPYNADAHVNTVAGIVRAFDASDLSIELWNSRQNAARDDFGNVAKYTPPTVANGKVYVATFSNQLVVYGLVGTSPSAPTVGSVSPSSGPTSGDTAVTIKGTNFSAGATVTLGGSAATGVSVVNSTTITATTPAHAAGAVNVTVTNANTQSATLAGGFTYTASGSASAPTVSSVSPSSGPTGGGTAVTITGTNFAPSAPLIADVFIDMNVANAIGTTLSVPMMTNGTVAVSAPTWEENPEPPTGFTLGAHLHDRNGSVQIGSTIHPANHPSKSMALDHAYNFRIERIIVPIGHPAATIAGFITFGPPNAGSSSNLFDYWEIQGRRSGDFAVLQLDNGPAGANGAGYGLSIETDPDGITTHSPYIPISPGVTYWCVLKSDFTSGIARLAVYEIVNWTLVGSVTASQAAGNENIGWINIGNNEVGLAPGTTSYFENLVIDYTSAAFPLGPGSPTNTSVSFGGSAASNVSSLNSTTLTATTPAHTAGAVNVTVTNPDGQSATLSNGFTYTAAPTPISFVQVAAATPQTPTGTVAVTYPSLQTPGDLNIVVVGWNDTTATVQSVEDSAGNTYVLAIGPTTGTNLRQSIYYARNIVGDSSTVSVTFSQAAVYPDIRILEYSGVGALDVTAGASGLGTTSNSGPATTTTPNELIFAANTVSTDTRSAGTGFTSRIITYIDSDIAEDRIVSSAGTYSATALMGASGNWVMQMATFEAVPAP